MKNASGREELMIRYLLGELPAEEQVRLEEQFFTDEESYALLLALEDELRYDYATGELAGRERERFKERFLVTPEDRKKVAFAGALISKLAPPESAVIPEVATSPWWRQLASLLHLQHPVLRYSFAAAALVVALGAVWLVSQRLRTGLPREIAGQTNASPESVREVPTPPKEAIVEQHPSPSPAREPVKPDGPSVSSIATFLLTPGLTRDAGEPTQLVIERKINSVRLQLRLKRKSEHASYRVVLQTLAGAEVWNSGLSARRSGAGQAVVVELPTRVLAAGDYELVLKGSTPTGNYEDVDEYYFRIVKK